MVQVVHQSWLPVCHCARARRHGRVICSHESGDRNNRRTRREGQRTPIAGIGCLAAWRPPLSMLGSVDMVLAAVFVVASGILAGALGYWTIKIGRNR